MGVKTLVWGSSQRRDPYPMSRPPFGPCDPPVNGTDPLKQVLSMYIDQYTTFFFETCMLRLLWPTNSGKNPDSGIPEKSGFRKNPDFRKKSGFRSSGKKSGFRNSGKNPDSGIPEKSFGKIRIRNSGKNPDSGAFLVSSLHIKCPKNDKPLSTVPQPHW